MLLQLRGRASVDSYWNRLFDLQEPVTGPRALRHANAECLIYGYSTDDRLLGVVDWHGVARSCTFPYINLSVASQGTSRLCNHLGWRRPRHGGQVDGCRDTSALAGAAWWQPPPPCTVPLSASASHGPLPHALASVDEHHGKVSYV